MKLIAHLFARTLRYFLCSLYKEEKKNVKNINKLPNNKLLKR